MKAYKNTKFNTRDYECTQIVACETEGDPKLIGDRQGIEWEPIGTVPAGLTQLYICNGVKYFGYL